MGFTNIWSYPTLDARSKARADAVAQGIWPPKGGPAHLTTAMTSTIALPTAVSPLSWNSPALSCSCSLSRVHEKAQELGLYVMNMPDELGGGRTLLS